METKIIYQYGDARLNAHKRVHDRHDHVCVFSDLRSIRRYRNEEAILIEHLLFSTFKDLSKLNRLLRELPPMYDFRGDLPVPETLYVYINAMMPVNRVFEDETDSHLYADVVAAVDEFRHYVDKDTYRVKPAETFLP